MQPLPFQIDSDIHRAHLPPAWLYQSDAAFDLVRERVLARAWHWIGDEAELAGPGSVLPRTLLQGVCDEPGVLVRDAAGETRFLSNVCTHRGALVCEQAGELRDLRCRYHGRRFALDGRFLAAPGFEGAEGFPTPADDLRRLALARWRGHLFASQAPNAAFDARFEGLLASFDFLPLERARFDAGSAQSYEIDVNWLLYLDNYLEGFHIPFVHPGLAAAVDYASYETELCAWSSVQIARARGGEHVIVPPRGAREAGERIAAWYVWLYPTTLLNFYPWGLSLNVLQPLSRARTRILFRSYVWDETLVESSAGTNLHQVEMEDEEVVSSVQAALRARERVRGRYSPQREAGVHHFHRLLCEELERG